MDQVEKSFNGFDLISIFIKNKGTLGIILLSKKV